MGSFRQYDAGINIDTDTPKDVELYNKLRDVLVGVGFTKEANQRILKNYPSLQYTHHYGSWKELEFECNYFERGIEFKFWHIGANRGGMDKLKEMPYLTRIRFRHSMNAIMAYLLEHGFVNETRPDHKGLNAYEYIKYRKQEYANYNFTLNESDRIDADGNRMEDGDIRYYYHWSGHLRVGRVYVDNGNQWWIVSNDSTWDRNGHWEYFSWKEDLPRRRRKDPDKRIYRELKAAIEKLNFKRARLLKNLLDEEGYEYRKPPMWRSKPKLDEFQEALESLDFEKAETLKYGRTEISSSFLERRYNNRMSFDFEEMTYMAIKVLKNRNDKRDRGMPLWSKVSDLYGLGSTYACHLCVEYGFDPDHCNPIKDEFDEEDDEFEDEEDDDEEDDEDELEEEEEEEYA